MFFFFVCFVSFVFAFFLFCFFVGFRWSTLLKRSCITYKISLEPAMIVFGGNLILARWLLTSTCKAGGKHMQLFYGDFINE